MPHRQTTDALVNFMRMAQKARRVEVASTDTGVLASFEISPGMREILTLRAEMEDGRPVLRARLRYGASEAECHDARKWIGSGTVYEGHLESVQGR